MAAKQCSVCGAAFGCGSATHDCWCTAFPAIMPLTPDMDCRCPACLKTVIREQIDRYLQQHPAPEAIPAQYHNKELVQDIDYYIENGKWVFTAWYHRKRGFCCGSGCRHCPYQHENVR